MVTPPVGSGDLFLVSAGPGHFPTVETLLNVAREAGGRTAAITAQPVRAAQMPVDLLINLPAQTMVDIAAGRSILTMVVLITRFPSCCLAICWFCAFWS